MSVGQFKYPKPGCWQTFQKLSRDLFQRRYDIALDEFARGGQEQFGIDLKGRIPPLDRWVDEMRYLNLTENDISKSIGIQCKDREDLSIDTIVEDYEKAIGNIQLQIRAFIVATSLKRDGQLQLDFDNKQRDRPHLKRIFFWDDFEDMLARNRDIAKDFGYFQYETEEEAKKAAGDIEDIAKKFGIALEELRVIIEQQSSFSQTLLESHDKLDNDVDTMEGREGDQ